MTNFSKKQETAGAKKKRMKKVVIGTIVIATLGTSAFANYSVVDYFTNKLENVKTMVTNFANKKGTEITNLQTELQNMTNAYNTVNGNLEAANQTIAEHEATIKTLNNTITGKETEIANLQAQIEQLEQGATDSETEHAAQIAELNEQITTLTNEKAALEGQVTELEDEVTGLNNAINLLKEKVGATEEMTAEEVAQAASDKIDQLETDLAEAVAKNEEDAAEIEYLTNLVNNANDKAEEVETYVAEVTGEPTIENLEMAAELEANVSETYDGQSAHTGINTIAQKTVKIVSDTGNVYYMTIGVKDTVYGNECNVYNENGQLIHSKQYKDMFFQLKDGKYAITDSSNNILYTFE